ncbi:MAG: hypothetical protein NVV82_08005 [Sporocytophaga sp.]|nr:hypothetical protein [Sporocytophaga sp.]
MKNKRTTTILGIIGFSLIAIIAAFKSVQDPKVAEGGSRTVTKKAEGKNACDVSNGRAALLTQKTKTSQTSQYDLGKLLAKKELIAVNREVTTSPDKKYSAVKISEKEGEGIVWIKDVKFSKGTIELDLKGKDVFQKSFIGVAFHGVDNKTFDGIYFRPFNFKATDSIRHTHAVQYINHPDFPWKKLRDEKEWRV